LAAFFLADFLVGFFLPALFAGAFEAMPRRLDTFFAADLRAGRAARPVVFFFFRPAVFFAARARTRFLTLAIV
jgi:hypothetical protein